MFKFSGTRPSNLGVKDGKLAACPSSPNCVNSQADDRHHGIGPLAFSGDAVTAMQKLAGVVAAIPRTQVIQSRADYLYVEFSTSFMGFVDDVEFYSDGEGDPGALGLAARLLRSRCQSKADRGDPGGLP